jgi:DNA-binding beta-propeller fold protein YncE
VAFDPTGKFAYVTKRSDQNVSAYSIAANGALVPVPGSPFPAGTNPESVAITPLVPFASSSAELEIERHHFDLKESFTLGANSDGIDPLTEKVTLQIRAFSAMIPAGSFKKTLEGYAFDGVIDGKHLMIQIVPLGNKIFTLNAVSRDAALTGRTNPVTVVLTIGINSGTTTVTARF